MALQDNDSAMLTDKIVPEDISRDFVKSIGSCQGDLVIDYSELTIDGLLNEAISGYEGIFESIPIVKTAVGVYSAYKGFSSFHFVKKLVSFVQKVNERVASEDEAKWFRDRFSGSDKDQYRYVEYLITMIDRYVGYDKPQMLAKLFIAFLDECISWEELVCYAEALEKLLPGDFSVLANSDVYRQEVVATPSAVLRLVGLGLMVETSRPSAFVPRQNGNVGITWDSLNAVQKNEIEYSRTTFGSKLVDIIRGDCTPPR